MVSLPIHAQVAKTIVKLQARFTVRNGSQSTLFALKKKGPAQLRFPGEAAFSSAHLNFGAVLEGFNYVCRDHVATIIQADHFTQ